MLDLVLQPELAPLQSGKVEHVTASAFETCGNVQVELAVLGPKEFNAGGRLIVVHGGAQMP